MSQDVGRGPAVADAGRPGRGSGVCDEDLAVEVDDGDLVVVGDDQDGFIASHPRSLKAEVSSPRPPEVSPMS